MFLKFICAVVTRTLFILISLIGVWRVTWVKQDKMYWFLTFLFLPLVLEMVLTLRGKKDHKWFSPAIFLFLISIVPSIWILELHQTNESDAKCKRLDSSESIKDFFNSWTNLTNGSDVYKMLQNSEKFLSSVCANNWILALHQTLLVLLIVGKWLMPIEGGLTRDQLSQLLLIFVGTAADILEFTSETLSDVNRGKNPVLVIVILAVWTWSMLQFPHHLTVLNSETKDQRESASSLAKYRTDIWAVVEALFIHDGPFLLVRITVMIFFDIIHQMLVFFAIKNFLVVVLNMYRLWVICWDSRSN